MRALDVSPELLASMAHPNPPASGVRRRTPLLARFCAPAIIPFVLGALALSLIPDLLRAQEADAGHHAPAVTILWIAIILLAARLSSYIERAGQPAVLGELLVGVLLGNLALVGITIFEPITADPILLFLAELGVIILLFQIGLESNLAQLGKVGARAMAVAVVGVVLPFATGTWLAGPLLLPGLDFNAYLFIGAALTATSVGITARVFKDLGTLHTPEAQIVLGAAVIDDVLGLVILAVVSAIVTAGSVSALVVGWIFLKALLFLAGSVVIGQMLAPRMGGFLSRIHAGAGMKFTLAVSFALVFAFVAGAIGLAPIVGAFAAGLVLDPVHFQDFLEAPMLREVRESVEGAEPATRERVLAVVHLHSHRHVEQLIESLGHFLVPIFFVITGMSVSLEALFDLPILIVALGITLVAVIGKIVAGLVAGDVRKAVVGWGMVPRGEVGLIFATMGMQLGVLPEAEFSVIIIMVILTTLMTPPILSYLLRKEGSAAPVEVPVQHV
jgi:Kef-type K+ transport system membrane component KefB